MDRAWKKRVQSRKGVTDPSHISVSLHLFCLHIKVPSRSLNIPNILGYISRVQWDSSSPTSNKSRVRMSSFTKSIERPEVLEAFSKQFDGKTCEEPLLQDWQPNYIILSSCQYRSKCRRNRGQNSYWVSCSKPKGNTPGWSGQSKSTPVIEAIQGQPHHSHCLCGTGSCQPISRSQGHWGFQRWRHCNRRLVQWCRSYGR